MSIYDEYMNLPEVENQMETSNLWGGAAAKRKREPSKYNLFVREYFKKAPNPSLAKAAKAYKSSGCAKKYTHCKSKTTGKAKPKAMTKSQWNKFQKEWGKAQAGNRVDMSDTYNSPKCTKLGWKYCKPKPKPKPKKRGMGVFGGVCPECSGQGMYGGCDCCGGELEEVGEVMEGGATAKKKAKETRCFTNRALHNNLDALYDILKTEPAGPRRGRYVGAFRELLSQYNRGNLLGAQYLRPASNKLPGITANMRSYGRSYPPLA